MMDTLSKAERAYFWSRVCIVILLPALKGHGTYPDLWSPSHRVVRSFPLVHLVRLIRLLCFSWISLWELRARCQRELSRLVMLPHTRGHLPGPFLSPLLALFAQ